MTIQKYRMMDLLVLSLIAVVIDVVGYFASQSQLIGLYVAISVTIMMIAYIRWQFYGLIINAVIILLHVILYRSDNILPLLLYALSLLSVSLSMVWFVVFKKSKIKDEIIPLTIYYVTGYLAFFGIQLLAQLSLEGSVQLVTLLIRHSFNFIFGWVILLIASKQKDFLVDMNAYLLKQYNDRQMEDKLP